ncbi:MAG: sulfide/dihydroorotate dehydrogenase-like FAD/NAD-binding protein [Clostridia bacterium]|jgi:ferredoxin--NADP+ reductase|uniref:sulfide/dihydroorotate dehydrogenase-like FAD/NAD-binding protein n=1 Tax=Pumilibacter muris TaxID=2941510 RepID=UPI00203A4DEF|nr:sulfide/dihydroorotate dehydrogenase-like FAD/NAD-binding protein [Pumilibacter muris]MCI8595610.1 sulfide/dihydroorotate dehydrogenase-like FAD/NAD-binding protein [Clostridia bacterium]
MNKIIKKTRLAENVTEYVISAPEVARHAHPGQFIILRVDEDGERVPFTICDYDSKAGTVTVLVQEVGYSTIKLSQIPEGGFISDFVGPLGNPTDLSEFKNILLIGGGIGAAVIYPQAKALRAKGMPSDVIVGARTASLLMYEKEFKAAAKNLYLITDDGTSGVKGFVTDELKRLAATNKYDCVFAVGPMPMMRAVCALTAELKIKTVVSMNSIMVDGTGMCGGCRLTCGGKTKYACVDGPEFDGHLIDWDEAISRSRIYREHESRHRCMLTGEER